MRTLLIKHILITILSFLLIANIKAQTSITTPMVSGVWNLVGSPYIVNVSINIPSLQSLTIMPGVTVKFMPTTKLTIDGPKIANGTSANPINFQANDTTNFSDTTTAAGGWYGLYFKTYSGSTIDNSILNHCVIKNVKYGYASSGPDKCALSCWRSLKILNTEISNNMLLNYSGATNSVIELYGWGFTDSIEVSNCVIKNNITKGIVLQASGSTGSGAFSFIKIRHTNISFNSSCNQIFGSVNNLLIDSCDIHHNNNTFTNAGLGAIYIMQNKSIVRNNKITNNICSELGALAFFDSEQSIIENNLICNNINNVIDCSITGGASALHLKGAGFPNNFNSPDYIIRNNVLANNEANGNVKGTVFINSANVNFTNNTIINNQAYDAFGNSNDIAIKGARAITIKNNVFNSKSINGFLDTIGIIHTLDVYSNAELKIENNFLPSSIYKSFIQYYPCIIVGDTTTNTIGFNPHLVIPTANNSYTTDATMANFNLLASSPCINTGDTTGCFYAAIDYIGANRINNTIIDIGAFEYQELATSTKNNIFDKTNVNIFPNPTNGIISINSSSSITKIEVCNVMGQSVFIKHNINTSNASIQLQDLTNGVYFINVYSLNGVTIKKIIKN